MMNSTAPVEIETSLAPGAAPAAVPVPSVSTTGEPRAMPETCVPCPPRESVSVSTDVGTSTTQSLPGSDSTRQRLLRLRTTRVLPSASANAGWVGSTPESMTATLTPVPSSAEPFAPTRVCRASSPRVATCEVVVDISMGRLPSR